MKRDMELIRAIMLAVESHEDGFAPQNLQIADYSEDEIGYHCYLIGNAGLADVVDTTHLGSSGPTADIARLTWQGHEFLDAARDDTIWNRTKERVAAAGKSFLTIPVSVLTALLVDEGKRQLGLSP